MTDRRRSIGKRGEAIAQVRLREMGYRVLEANYRVPIRRDRPGDPRLRRVRIRRGALEVGKVRRTAGGVDHPAQARPPESRRPRSTFRPTTPTAPTGA